MAGSHAQGTWAEAGRGVGGLGPSALSTGPPFPEEALPSREGVSNQAQDQAHLSDHALGHQAPLRVTGSVIPRRMDRQHKTAEPDLCTHAGN